VISNVLCGIRLILPKIVIRIISDKVVSKSLKSSRTKKKEKENYNGGKKKISVI